jgi:hypothetical protein
MCTALWMTEEPVTAGTALQLENQMIRFFQLAEQRVRPFWADSSCQSSKGPRGQQGSQVYDQAVATLKSQAQPSPLQDLSGHKSQA